MCPHLFVICSSYTLWLPIFFQWLIIHYYAWLFWCTNPFGFIHWKPRARLSCGLATWSPWTSTGTQAIAQTGCLVQEFHLMGGKSPRTETFKSISWQWTTNREKKKENSLTEMADTKMAADPCIVPVLGSESCTPSWVSVILQPFRAPRRNPKVTSPRERPLSPTQHFHPYWDSTLTQVGQTFFLLLYEDARTSPCICFSSRTYPTLCNVFTPAYFLHVPLGKRNSKNSLLRRTLTS